MNYEKYGKPGDRILDTHMGSGSIAIATNKMRFELVACERDKDYYDAACKRISDAQRQESLFDVYEQVDRSYKQAGLI
jgi:site-specific DNA-methyltransferase (adenine-specific)